MPGAHVVHDIDQAISLARQLGKEDIVIGGGGELFRQTLPVTERVYLSIVHADFDGETFYPELPKDEFVEKTRKEIDASIPYAFVEFERVKGK